MIRAALVVVSLLALAWIGVLARDHALAQAASERISENPKLPAGELAREMKRLKDAELLNPDSSWELYRGSYWLLRNHQRRAASVAEDLVRREPDNIRAWTLLLNATSRLDPRRSEQAQAQVERLNPQGAG